MARKLECFTDAVLDVDTNNTVIKGREKTTLSGDYSDDDDYESSDDEENLTLMESALKMKEMVLHIIVNMFQVQVYQKMLTDHM